MRLGYFGPEGTFTAEALQAAMPAGAHELIALPTIHDTAMAVHDGRVERALVPIENSLEGSVNATLDALVEDTDEVVIVGEVIHSIRHCLIAREELALDEIEAVLSHPQPLAQCARFLRTKMPRARPVAAASTAEAVGLVSRSDRPEAALGNRFAAELHRCVVLAEGVEDVEGNETRFAWLARGDDVASASEGANTKTTLVFWGPGAEASGWLVRCLSEFASRGVNLTRIESRPRKQGLGRYMFFLDVEGASGSPRVAEALAALARHVERVRILGSYPAA